VPAVAVTPVAPRLMYLLGVKQVFGGSVVNNVNSYSCKPFVVVTRFFYVLSKTRICSVAVKCSMVQRIP